MKRLITGIVVILLTLLAFTGCKETTEPLVFSASEDILGTWMTENPVTISDGEGNSGDILAPAFFDIYDGETEFWVDAVYTLLYGEGDLDNNNWDGVITPDPTTSAYCTITVENSNGGLASPAADQLVSFVYNMSGTDAATFYVDGDAYFVVREEGD